MEFNVVGQALRLPNENWQKLLIAQKKERNRSDRANRVHDRGVGDEVRKDHQRQAAEHQLPEIHSFAVNERDKADGAEEQIPDQISSTQTEHVDLAELEARHL